jgi:outer membrane protein assembly factor BamE (lipoprotein component of BamABCDE complex)
MMKTLASKVIAALILAAALAGCASTGSQETLLDHDFHQGPVE